jgi:CRP-like cAMP-binding protein
LLIREGEPESPVFVLATGWASRSKLMPDGRELILQLHLPGDIIGYTPALLHGRPHFSVQALTTVTYYPLDRERVAGLFATAPALARKLLLRLSRRQRTVEYWLLNLGRRRVEERLAWFLLDLFARLRRLGLVRDNTFRLPLSQRQIADAIGAHVVHLNRVLRQFREAGLVSMRGREVRLDDPVRFRRVGCFCAAGQDTA